MSCAVKLMWCVLHLFHMLLFKEIFHRYLKIWVCSCILYVGRVLAGRLTSRHGKILFTLINLKSCIYEERTGRNAKENVPVHIANFLLHRLGSLSTSEIHGERRRTSSSSSLIVTWIFIYWLTHSLRLSVSHTSPATEKGHDWNAKKLALSGSLKCFISQYILAF